MGPPSGHGRARAVVAGEPTAALAYDADVLDGHAVLVTHTATRLGHDLAAALVDLGASVTEVADSCADRATADKAFARAATVDAVVHVCVDDAGLTAQPLVDTTPGEWDARARRCSATRS